MGEYEDRYPEAYGHREVIDQEGERHFTGTGLPRQTRDAIPPTQRPPAAPRPAPHLRTERPVRQLIARPPQEIRADVLRQLNDSPFVDASGIAVTVDGSEVMLDGTINSLMGISLAQALCSNVAGIGRVQVRLRVQPNPRRYEAPAATTAR
jgi:hypothetical protein